LARLLGNALTEELSACYPEASFAFFADHSPIDERDAAAKCGLGVIGDNHLLISPKYGSYVFLAELITDLAFPSLSGPAPIGQCLHCGACSRACPSPANCLSAITQKKGELTEPEVDLMRKNHTIWGCDICQQVYPMNQRKESTPIPYFRENRIYHLTKEILDTMDGETFRKRAFAWRGRKTIERNLKAVEENN
jgi:epoxyqueuosine reductase